MKNWTSKPFREIATFPPKVSLVKEESYSFIPMDAVNEGYKFVSPQESKQWVGGGGAKFENGDTLFARITPCLQNGKIAQAKNLPNGKGFGSTEFFVFRGKENVSDSNFIYYLAKTQDFRSYAIGSMVGASGRQRADATYVGNYEISLPPLPIQKRIAEILTTYDDLIENNLKRIKLLEELAQRTYEEWFVKFRVNGEQLPIDESTGLPVGWERTKLGELGDITSSKRIFLSDYVENGIPFYRSKEIIQKYNFENVEDPLYISHERYNEIKKKFGKPEVGDFLITSVGTLGYVHMVNDTDGDFYFKDGNLIWIRKVKSRHLLPMLFLKLRSSDFKIYLNSIAIGSSQKALTIESLKKIDFTIPIMDVLKKYEEFANPIIKQLFALSNLNRLLKQSRDILLPRLMNGEINVEEVKDIKELETA